MFLGSGRARGANRSARGEGIAIDSPQSLSGSFGSEPHYLDSRTGRATPTITRTHDLCIAGVFLFRDSSCRGARKYTLDACYAWGIHPRQCSCDLFRRRCVSPPVVIVTYFRALAPCLGTVSEYFAKSSSSACRTSRLCGISVRVESSLSFSAVSAGRYKLTCTPVRCAMYSSLYKVMSTYL